MQHVSLSLIAIEQNHFHQTFFYLNIRTRTIINVLLEEKLVIIHDNYVTQIMKNTH